MEQSFKRSIPVSPQFDVRLVERFENRQRIQRWIFALGALGLIMGVVAVLVPAVSEWLLVPSAVIVFSVALQTHLAWRCLACDGGLGLRFNLRRCPHCDERLRTRNS
ncbi:MAG: hypothetical protein ACFB21_03805 [Opitutales bacterium]